jgi:hypothetical protein
MKFVVILTLVALSSAVSTTIPSISTECFEDILGLYNSGKALVIDIQAYNKGEGDVSSLLGSIMSLVGKVKNATTDCAQPAPAPTSVRGDASCIGDLLNLFNTAKDLVADVKALISGGGSDFAKLIADVESAIS